MPPRKRMNKPEGGVEEHIKTARTNIDALFVDVHDFVDKKRMKFCDDALGNLRSTTSELAKSEKDMKSLHNSLKMNGVLNTKIESIGKSFPSILSQIESSMSKQDSLNEFAAKMDQQFKNEVIFAQFTCI